MTTGRRTASSRRSPAAAGDLLDEAVLRPVVILHGDPLSAVVEDPGEMPVELRVVDELLLPPPRRRRRHRPPIELVHPRRRCSPGGKSELETVALTPRIRAHGQTVLA